MLLVGEFKMASNDLSVNPAVFSLLGVIRESLNRTDLSGSENGFL